MATPHPAEIDPDDSLFVLPSAGNAKGNKKPTKVARRSSILNIVKRQSKSIVGIPFEDQIATIDREAPVKDRLQHLYRICAKTTLSNLQREASDESNVGVSDVIDDICSEMRKKIHACDEDLATKANEEIVKLEKNSEGSRQDPQELLPSRVKATYDYTKKLTEEQQVWKKLLADHKEEYLEARNVKKSVEKGQCSIGSHDLKKLFNDDLLSISGGCDFMVKLLQQEKQMSWKENETFLQLKRAKKRKFDASNEVDLCMTKLIRRTAEQHEHLVKSSENKTKPLLSTERESFLRGINK